MLHLLVHLVTLRRDALCMIGSSFLALVLTLCSPVNPWRKATSAGLRRDDPILSFKFLLPMSRRCRGTGLRQECAVAAFPLIAGALNAATQSGVTRAVIPGILPRGVPTTKSPWLTKIFAPSMAMRLLARIRSATLRSLCPTPLLQPTRFQFDWRQGSIFLDRKGTCAGFKCSLGEVAQ